MLLLDRFQPFGHGIGHGNRIGVGCPVDGGFDALPAVDAGDDLALFVPAKDIGDAAQSDLDIAPSLDDDVFDLLDVLELVDGPDQILAVLLFENPGGEIDVFLGQPAGHRGDGDIEQAELLLVDIDVDLILQAAGDGTGGHAFDALQGLFDLPFRDVADAGQIGISGQAQLHDRFLVGIVAEDDRLGGTHRKTEKIQFFPEFQGGEIHVGVPGELDRDFGELSPGDGGDADDIVHNTTGFLDGFGDDVFDLRGSCSRVFGFDGQGGIGDLGQKIQVQSGIGDEAEDDRRHGEHEDRHRAVDGKLDESSLDHFDPLSVFEPFHADDRR